MTSVSYRFNVANAPIIATLAMAHCPKRLWTLTAAPLVESAHFRFLLSCAILFSSARFRSRALVLLSDLDSAYASIDFR